MRTSASLSTIGRRVISWKRVPDARHEAPDVDDALLHDHDRGGEPLLERQASGDRGQRGFERLGVERGLHDRRDHLVLVGERPEDRAFGDPGGLGDLAARDPVAVLDEERQRGGDDHRAPLIGRQRGRPSGLRLSVLALDVLALEVGGRTGRTHPARLSDE